MAKISNAKKVGLVATAAVAGVAGLSTNTMSITVNAAHHHASHHAHHRARSPFSSTFMIVRQATRVANSVRRATPHHVHKTSSAHAFRNSVRRSLPKRSHHKAYHRTTSKNWAVAGARKAISHKSSHHTHKAHRVHRASSVHVMRKALPKQARKAMTHHNHKKASHKTKSWAVANTRKVMRAEKRHRKANKISEKNMRHALHTKGAKGIYRHGKLVGVKGPTKKADRRRAVRRASSDFNSLSRALASSGTRHHHVKIGNKRNVKVAYGNAKRNVKIAHGTRKHVKPRVTKISKRELNRLQFNLASHGMTFAQRDRLLAEAGKKGSSHHAKNYGRKIHRAKRIARVKGSASAKAAYKGSAFKLVRKSHKAIVLPSDLVKLNRNTKKTNSALNHVVNISKARYQQASFSQGKLAKNNSKSIVNTTEYLQQHGLISKKDESNLYKALLKLTNAKHVTKTDLLNRPTKYSSNHSRKFKANKATFNGAKSNTKHVIRHHHKHDKAKYDAEQVRKQQINNPALVNIGKPAWMM